MPDSAAATMVMIMARARTEPNAAEENHRPPTAPTIAAKTSPLIRPTMLSRRMILQALEAVRSLVANARTATVSDWVPALPPMDATMGMSTARATIIPIASENWLMTTDAAIAVARLTISHGNRWLAVSSTRS